MPTKPYGDEAFFQRRATHLYIDELSALNDVVIYVGAGASVERTGLSWLSLAAQLLDADLLGDFADRVDLTRAFTPLAMSSVIEEQYKTQSPDDWRDRLAEALRRQLYRGDKHLRGYFNPRVARLASDYIRAGRRAIVVTPNYDDFLVEAALLALSETAVNAVEAGEAPAFDRVERFVFGVAEKPDARKALKEEFDAMKATVDGVDDRALRVIHIHGLVEREPRPHLREVPKDVHAVVSEADYANTRERSKRVLQHLFKDRDIIIVGSGLTDPPLIHALLQTKPDIGSTHKRFVVQPQQGRDLGRYHGGEKALAEADGLRARHLGVTQISTDFYFQAPQLLEEVRVDLDLERSNMKYSSASSKYQYEHRLNAWWRAWLYDPLRDADLQRRQKRTHVQLAKALDYIKGLIEAKPDEPLRLEAWLRWKPPLRRLSLFASSVGTWTDLDTMRSDFINPDSIYAATRAFTNGAPTYGFNDEEGARWKTFLAVPFRYVDGKKAFLPIGVFCLGSTWPKQDSVLAPRQGALTGDLTQYLESLAGTMFYPSRTEDDAPAATND